MKDRDTSESDLNEVLSEYERSIKIPESKPTSQFFLCTVGMIGSGKTTVIKPLAEKLSLVRISSDEIRKVLHDKGLGYDSTWDIASRLANKFAREGHSIANDTDGATPRTRVALEELASELGSKVFYIHINTPEEVILNRLRNYEPSWLFKSPKHAVENYLNRKPLHENLVLTYIYTFDTSRDDLQEQIDKAMEIILVKSGNKI